MGITHNVSSVRAISLETISQLVKAAGSLLKPALIYLIPALINATGELSSPGLSHFRNAYCISQEIQEAFDNKRASDAKTFSTTETITKVCRFTILIAFVQKTNKGLIYTSYTVRTLY